LLTTAACGASTAGVNLIRSTPHPFFFPAHSDKSRNMLGDRETYLSFHLRPAIFVYFAASPFALLPFSPYFLGVLRYFLAATLTTVGFGDYYPETETAKGLAIVLLPFGLVIISFGISIAVAEVRLI